MKIIEIEPDKLSEIMEPVNKGKTCYLLLYANWCGHCTEFKPVWNSIHSEMKNELVGLNAIMAQIEQQSIDKINSKPKFMENILGYPTIRVIDINGFEDYEGEREKESIKKNMRLKKKKGGRKTRKCRSRKTRRYKKSRIR